MGNLMMLLLTALDWLNQLRKIEHRHRLLPIFPARFRSVWHFCVILLCLVCPTIAHFFIFQNQMQRILSFRSFLTPLPRIRAHACRQRPLLLRRVPGHQRGLRHCVVLRRRIVVIIAYLYGLLPLLILFHLLLNFLTRVLILKIK